MAKQCVVCDFLFWIDYVKKLKHKIKYKHSA
jgi:hypothetical protein